MSAWPTHCASRGYHQIAARRGNKRAVVAVAHSILVIYYHMLTTGEPYQEKGANYFSELDRKHVLQALSEESDVLRKRPNRGIVNLAVQLSNMIE